jgi:hypothetical protein
MNIELILSLLCRPNQHLFKADVQSGVAIKNGDIVSFYHSGFTKLGAPLNPEIYHVRKDITWEDVVNSDNDQPTEEELQQQPVNSTTFFIHVVPY